MAAAIAQTAYRASLLAANGVVISRIRDAVSQMPADAIARRPPTGGWSVAEVLEHLIVSADSYLDRVRTLINTSNGTVDANATWKPSLMGGLLVSSFRSSRKLPAPKIYKPGPSPRPNVLQEFLRRQEDVGRLISEAASKDWQHTRMRSPVVSIIRMNLGDALTVLVTHAERHAGQIERVKTAVSASAPST